jgi:PBP1b-binding outer membrane lipoprotein LpoB
MKISIIFILFFLNACSFLIQHPDLVQDVVKAENDIVEDVSKDLKMSVDNKPIKQ